MKEDKGITYSESGVDIVKADRLVDRIKEKVKKTYTDGVIGDIGGFGGLFAPDFKKYDNPVLVSGTDGVGTKLKIAVKLGIHNTIGIDLVAMCINDILAQGAFPLFFLDYLACGNLEIEVNEAIIDGIVEGCKQAEIALIGGETAEMPGFYANGEYDVAGFAVGIADRNQLITGEKIESGDLLIGLPSSGVHSNGFSLIRYLLDKKNIDLNLKFTQETTLGEELLKPTRIYVQQIKPVLKKFNLKGIAHITGGGIIENIPRILPENLQAVIDTSSWPVLPIFDWIKEKGNIEKEEMYKTFNQGIGMVLAIDPREKNDLIDFMEKLEEEVYVIGQVTDGKKGVILQ